MEKTGHSMPEGRPSGETVETVCCQQDEANDVAPVGILVDGRLAEPQDLVYHPSHGVGRREPKRIAEVWRMQGGSHPDGATRRFW